MPPSVEIRPAATVMLVRDAATVMLVRDARAAETVLEVLMVRRNLKSDFVGGAYVFPGGAVDLADGGAEAEALCAGRSDAEASALLGFPSGGLAYWVAVCARPSRRPVCCWPGGTDGPALLAGDAGEEARLAGARLRVNDGSLRFLDLCRDEDLRLSVDQIHYFAHWITPRGAPRRYDTRFFVAAAPPGQRAAHDAGETIAEVWITPDDALAQHRAGDIEIIFPTIRTLQAIGRFSTSTALLDAAAEARARCPPLSHVSSPTARHAHRAAGRSLLRARPRGRPGRRGALGDFNEAVRAVSMQANMEGPDAAPGPRPEP